MRKERRDFYTDKTLIKTDKDLNTYGYKLCNAPGVSKCRKLKVFNGIRLCDLWVK
jgi:hypothetical protein